MTACSLSGFGRALPHVSLVFSLVGEALALVGLPLPLISDAVATVGEPLPPCGSPLAPLDGSLALFVSLLGGLGFV